MSTRGISNRDGEVFAYLTSNRVYDLQGGEIGTVEGQVVYDLDGGRHADVRRPRASRMSPRWAGTTSSR